MNSSPLTAGQRALLREALVQRLHQLDSRLASHHEGLSRTEHAREVLQQDADDAPQRDSDRVVDLALTDMETVELGEVSQALARLNAEPNESSSTYGRCARCAADIAFDRLRAKPWATLCLDCANAQERAMTHTR